MSSTQWSGLEIREWLGYWLQLVYCTYLLTLSNYFQQDQILDFGVKSEVSLYGEECRVIVIGIDDTDRMGDGGIE